MVRTKTGDQVRCHGHPKKVNPEISCLAQSGGVIRRLPDDAVERNAAVSSDEKRVYIGARLLPTIFRRLAELAPGCERIHAVPVSKKLPLNATVEVAQRLARAVDALEFASPSHIYNPLRYAWLAHRVYLQHYGNRRGRVLLLGMNPGPWGMAQTGVPFGDVVLARDWLGIETPLQPPLPLQHPKYPITGFECHRREGSGSRVWGWARDRFGCADHFFERFFVWNYCPLLFIKDGRNLPPGQLHRVEADPLITVCNAALRSLLEVMAPAAVIGVGRYAESRAREVVGERLPVGYLPHPSPANPAANRNWPALAEAALAPWMEEKT